MMFCYLGNKGEGKTLSVVKQIIDLKQEMAFTNFRVRINEGLGVNYHRLKFSDIVAEETTEAKKKILKPNWRYWDKVRTTYNSYSVYLDEVHNIIHARAALSSRNKAMSKWVSQIRKVLSDSKDNHLFLISQQLRKIDIDFRDMSDWFVECKKLEIGNKVIIYQFWHYGLQAYYMRTPAFTRRFLGNPYFKYYNTLDFVIFQDADVYIP